MCNNLLLIRFKISSKIKVFNLEEEKIEKEKARKERTEKGKEKVTTSGITSGVVKASLKVISMVVPVLPTYT